MPALSLVVCVYRERAMLERLLRETKGLYDDLVVIHDGPAVGDALESQPAALDYARVKRGEYLDPYRESKERVPGSDAELVLKEGGRFLEGPRCFQQEPHWPYAWSQAKHDWILRLDADEYPSDELKRWLHAFREGPEPGADVSGYTCIWPLWDGKKAVSTTWPAGRQFLFHRHRIRFFGMVEQIPVADGAEVALPLILHHRPRRKSYGLGNLVLRRQAYHWRRVIARSLLGQPIDLPRWRWDAAEWPTVWEAIRRHPGREALRRLLLWPLIDIRNLWRKKQEIRLSAVLCAPVHHSLICLNYWWLRWRGATARRTL